MWIVAFVAMITKYAEIILAVKYRVIVLVKLIKVVVEETELYFNSDEVKSM